MAAKLLCGVLVLTLFIYHSREMGQRCYQCTDSGEDSDCRNATLLLNITNKNFKVGSEKEGEWKRNKYYKECNNENFTMCMIETFKANEKIKSFLRGCFDGNAFSFDPEKYVRLKNLPANNETTCTFDPEFAGQHVCVSICDGDMCNGPVPVPVSCRNETDEYTGETTEICAAPSLFHFLNRMALHTGMSLLVQFLAYM